MDSGTYYPQTAKARSPMIDFVNVDRVNVDRAYEKPIFNRKLYFEEQDNIRDQVNKIWIKYDINRSGSLDKIESANFLRDFCASNGKQAPNMQSFSRFYM